MTRTRPELESFCKKWAPTVLAFATLYLGNEEVAIDVTTNVLAEYVESNETLHMEVMPLRFWDCVVRRVTGASILVAPRPSSEFDRALMKLEQEERLIFLLRSVFELHVRWITVITEYTEQSAMALDKAATLKMKCYLYEFAEMQALSLSSATDGHQYRAPHTYTLN